jgi:AcrR family transcriptional regulator
MARPKQNLYGQEMGNKGTLTRARILKATAELMEKRPIRELKVAEIGAVAAVSSSTFYIYFESVSEAALAVVEALDQSQPEIMRILERPWSRETVAEYSKEFVQSYFAYWDRHHALLRVRNFAADEGNKKFIEARKKSIEPLHLAMQRKITEFQDTDRNAPKLHPPSTVSVLLAMLERTAAIVRLPSAHKATRSRQIESAAFLLGSTMYCGQGERQATKEIGIEAELA